MAYVVLGGGKSETLGRLGRLETKAGVDATTLKQNLFISRKTIFALTTSS